MTKEILWSACFIVGSIMDSFTTYYNLHKVLPELKGKELNPLFAPHIEKHWTRIMTYKFIGVIGIVVFCLFIHSLFLLVIISLMIWMTVANNSYIYLYKHIKKKQPLTIGIILVDKFHIPLVLAFLIVSVANVTLSIYLFTLLYPQDWEKICQLMTTT